MVFLKFTDHILSKLSFIWVSCLNSLVTIIDWGATWGLIAISLLCSEIHKNVYRKSYSQHDKYTMISLFYVLLVLTINGEGIDNSWIHFSSVSQFTKIWYGYFKKWMINSISPRQIEFEKTDVFSCWKIIRSPSLSLLWEDRKHVFSLLENHTLSVRMQMKMIMKIICTYRIKYAIRY